MTNKPQYLFLAVAWKAFKPLVKYFALKMTDTLLPTTDPVVQEQSKPTKTDESAINNELNDAKDERASDATNDVYVNTKPEENVEGKLDESDRHFVRIRGLPYSATPDDIKKFFDKINVTDVYVMHNSEGKPNGEAYVQLASAEDLEKALDKHQNSIGKRYIEVFSLGEVEINQAIRRMQMRSQMSEQGTVRVRGLPFSCRKDDLIGFFKGLDVGEVVFGKESEWGRPTGEAYVRFNSKADADQALQLNNQYLGTRYLEIFHVDGDAYEVFKQRMTAPSGPRPRPLAEVADDPWSYYPRRNAPPHSYHGGHLASNAHGGYGQSYNYDPYAYDQPPIPPPSQHAPPYVHSMPPYGQHPHVVPPTRHPAYNYPPQRDHGWGAPAQRSYDYGDSYGRGNYAPNGNYVAGELITPLKVHMRGLPYRVTAQQIEGFFAPLSIVEIKVGVFKDGRASGDGIIEFQNPHDATEALKRDRNCIKNRAFRPAPPVGPPPSMIPQQPPLYMPHY
ncbi:Heterogeneous nuclear ribonucleoprotein H3 [Aphelenchoides besseyi]|nr:Heterogeneous nuclear ribonucleoprotein H3 [Aphelenchoides besseyi]